MTIDTLRKWGGYRMPRLGRTAFRLFQRWGPREIDSELLPGIRATLDMRDATQMTTWWQGERFERETCARLRRWLPGTTRFFDIGSNYGFFSCLCLSASPSVRVDAFEPHPRTFSRLSGIKERNRLDRLSCWNMGLSDREDRLPLHPGTEDLGHTTFGAHPEHPADPALIASLLPFETWRRNAGIPLPAQPEWIAKIDVEGFELKVLRGMTESLRARAFKGLVVEFNADTLEFCGATEGEVLRFLADAGYAPLNPPAGRCSFPENVFFVPRDAAA